MMVIAAKQRLSLLVDTLKYIGKSAFDMKVSKMSDGKVFKMPNASLLWLRLMFATSPSCHVQAADFLLAL